MMTYGGHFEVSLTSSSSTSWKIATTTQKGVTLVELHNQTSSIGSLLVREGVDKVMHYSYHTTNWASTLTGTVSS